ncbi:SH3 domain-containing protein [Alteromonas alba]|jgi:hypothetical protein|uniref:SH3b domain-containing protein n=1 Tax=Alteromonas alba TaxID=2079529 RepID=A0A2S9V6A3_9ALTE|nr:SH3 domain-containing protein [Alteromonas alba]MCP4866380.1 SH3 domain-containing protein [Alteromonas sp.]PRO71981.1 hypothetical protein C6Y40_18840 [Alteromonas alba]
MKKGQTTARSGLCLRAQPKTGAIIGALEYGSQLEVISEETWLKVKTVNGTEGYVLADYVELSNVRPPKNTQSAANNHIITYRPFTSLIQGKPVKIDIAFKPVMIWLEKQLQKHDLSMWVTSSLREPGQPVSEAVVNPASLSNHLVGHAIDMNLFTPSEWFNSNRLERINIIDKAKSRQIPLDDEEKVRRFLYSIVHESKSELGFELRWGGHFAPSDPVHIDDGINVKDNHQYWTMLKKTWPSLVT